MSNYGLGDGLSVRTQGQIRNLTSRHFVKLNKLDSNWEEMLKGTIPVPQLSQN